MYIHYVFNPYPTEINYLLPPVLEPDQPEHPCSLTRLYTVG